MKHKFTLLLALLCASMMTWAQEPVTGSSTENMAGQGNSFTNGYDYSFSSEGTNVTISFTEKEDYIGLVAYLWDYTTGGMVETQMTVSGSTATITLTGQTPGATIRFACKFAYSGGMSVTKEFTYTIPVGEGGGEEPDPTPEPEPGTYTANGHTIHLDAYYIVNGESKDYTLVITSDEAMEGLGGSFWNVNGVGTDVRSNMTISDDKKTIICKATSTTDPNIYTPLYVLMPGEVNFGNITLDWVDRTPIASEYCNYQGPETLGGGKYITLTWETDADGNVVITMGNGTGASSCSFRNGGFEGGIDAFVVSTDDFVTTTPASNYFTSVGVYSGNTYTLTKIADVPAGAKIKHIGAGHALAWTVDDASPYTSPDFIYTYGGTCNQLDAPTNVVVSADSVITFNEVAGATRYTAYVYLGGIEKYKQDVVSGDVLHLWPYVDGDYIVNLIASGEGKTDSDPSADFTWTLAAREVVLGASEYCEKIMSSGNTEAAFTWETTDEGAIIITITESLGGAADAAHFRRNGMAIGNFKIGSSKSNASDYFNHACDGGNQVILTLKDPVIAPVKGEKIYFKGTVEYATSKDGNAWPTLEFEYTYGAVCVGKTVSANVNNAAMGTAVVKKGDEVVSSVEAGTEVTFIATIADAEKYRFVNWTKAGVEVSTDLNYTTTITETTNLVANFEYILYTFCHYPVEATGGTANGKKIFITLGKNASGKYQILFEGSAEAPLLALNNANYIVNHVSTDIAVEGVNGSGNDVPFSSANGRWSFDAAGLGSAKMEFTLEEGRTISDIYVWTRYIAFAVEGGDLIYNSDEIFDQLRYNIDWNATCADEEAPVITTAKAEVQNESTVLLTLTATDNWQGMLTYTIAREGAEDITLQAVSGEEVAQEITGLTAGTEYTFNITVSDGKFTTNTSLTATPLADEEKPVMVSATLESKTWDNAVIAVEATDNKAVVKYHLVDATNSIDAEFVLVDGKISIDGLTANTEYNFTITAKDAAGNESENNKIVTFTTDQHLTAPLTAAPVPTWPADQVKSLYSDSYTSTTTWNYLAGWEQTTQLAAEAIDGNNMLHYSNFNYLGWEIANGAPINALNMEYLHIDIWADQDGQIGIVPIFGGAGLTTDDSKRKIVTLKGQQWNSFDLKLDTEFAGLDLSSIWQVKFDNGTIAAFYIDNAYFYRKTPIVDDVVPTNLTVSVNKESFYSIALDVQAEDNMASVSFSIKNGETEVATGAAASGATTTITVNNLTPNTNYTFTVIAKDEADNAAESVSVNAKTLAVPAPAPAPTYPADLVKSLYSNAYAPAATLGDTNENWWQAPTNSEVNLGEGNMALLYENIPATSTFGWAFSTTFDAIGYQTLHMSIYPLNSGTIEIYPVIQPEAEFHRTSQTLVANQWNEVVIDFSDKTFTTFAQLGFTNYSALGAFFIDNVYFTCPIATTTVDGWGTFASAGNVQVPTGVKAYKAAYSNNGGNEVLVLTELADGVIPAGEGVLIEGAASTTYGFTSTATTPATDMTDNDLIGTTTLTDVSAQRVTSDIFCLRRTELFGTTAFCLYSGQYIPAGKAYLALPQINGQAGAPRNIRMVFNTATGIEDVQGTPVQGTKVIENGQLIIIRDGKRYNAQGVRVQ